MPGGKSAGSGVLRALRHQADDNRRAAGSTLRFGGRSCVKRRASVGENLGVGEQAGAVVRESGARAGTYGFFRKARIGARSAVWFWAIHDVVLHA